MQPKTFIGMQLSWHFTILVTKTFHWNATFMTFYYSCNQNLSLECKLHDILQFLQPKTFIGMQLSWHFTILVTKKFHWNANFPTFYNSCNQKISLECNFHDILHFLQPKTFVGMQLSWHFIILVTKNFHWNANFHHILQFL